MGVYAIFNKVKEEVQAINPLVEFLITAEAIQFQGAPPKVVWELPAPGGEEFSRKQLGPGYSPTTPNGKVIWTRKVNCNIHVWMDAATNLNGDLEYPDDNESAVDGPVWLVQQVIWALEKVTKGQYEMLAGGWGPRVMGNLGFLYMFNVSFLLPVFYNTAGLNSGTITSYVPNPQTESPT
jgi:hypothetical protein